jgi:hypothetical protein
MGIREITNSELQIRGRDFFFPRRSVCSVDATDFRFLGFTLGPFHRPHHRLRLKSKPVVVVGGAMGIQISEEPIADLFL